MQVAPISLRLVRLLLAAGAENYISQGQPGNSGSTESQAQVISKLHDFGGARSGASFVGKMPILKCCAPGTNRLATRALIGMVEDRAAITAVNTRCRADGGRRCRPGGPARQS